MANWKKHLEKVNNELSCFGIYLDVEYSHSDRQYSIYQTQPNCIICKQDGLLKGEICEFLDVIAIETIERMTESVDDVRHFFGWLVECKDLCFHPDDDFKDYICYETKQRTFTDQEANALNDVMEKCFDICEDAGRDIYEIASYVLLPL